MGAGTIETEGAIQKKGTGLIIILITYAVADQTWGLRKQTLSWGLPEDPLSFPMKFYCVVLIVYNQLSNINIVLV